MRLIDADELLKKYTEEEVSTTFNLPVEEVLGKDVNLDDFVRLVQDAILEYRKLTIDTINKQPTAFDIEKVENCPYCGKNIRIIKDR